MLNNISKRNYYCKLVNEEVIIIEGTVPTKIDASIPQCGCSKERNCKHIKEEMCALHK